MRPLGISLAMLGVYLAAQSVPATATQVSSEQKRILHIEKRIKELEKIVGQLQERIKALNKSAHQKKAGLDAKVIGSWGAVESGKNGLAAIRLEEKGSCKLVACRDRSYTKYKGTYEVIGKTILFKGTYDDGSGRIEFTLEVVSVTEKEIIIRSRVGMISDEKGENESRLERQ